MIHSWRVTHTNAKGTKDYAYEHVRLIKTNVFILTHFVALLTSFNEKDSLQLCFLEENKKVDFYQRFFVGMNFQLAGTK